jgi:CDP-diacylglycerol---glycerol-3-phosphate 3-phosphatidyltransferase
MKIRLLFGKENWGNLFTALRVVLSPLAMWLLMSEGIYYAVTSVVVVVIIAATDGLDGYFARKFNPNSSFGEIFDITADIIANQLMLLALVQIGWLPVWVLALILVREITIAQWRAFLAAKTGKFEKAKGWGKLKTASQFTAIIGVAVVSVATAFGVDGVPLFWMELVVTTSIYFMAFMVVYSWACYASYFWGITRNIPS